MDNQFTDTNVIDLVASHIDLVSVLLVLLGGLFAKKYLGKVKAIGTQWKTLLMSFIFITVYIALLSLSGGLYKADYTKYFISYCFGTTLYELLLKKLLQTLGLDKKDKPDTDRPLPKV